MSRAIPHRDAAATELPLADGVWTVDPHRSEIGFAVRSVWGLQTVRGVFGACQGSLTVRDGAAAGELAIDAGSLDTGHAKRDEHLRSADFFDVERHPRIAFVATSVTAHDGGPLVTGELTIGSARVRLDIPVDVEHTPDGSVRLEGRTAVSRTAAGLTWNRLGMVRDEAVLHARLTLSRQWTSELAAAA
jgi:polyisoprenoid-binding protein YceI